MKNYPSVNQSEINNTLKDFALFIKTVFVFILNSLRRFYLLFLLLFLGIAGAWYFQNKDSANFYSAQMSCSFNFLHKKVYGEMIVRANQLAESQSYNALARELNISPDDARKVVRLEARNIAGSPLHEDITEQKLPIYITAITTDREVFPALEEGILYYFNNKIPYHQARMKLERINMEENIGFTKSTIVQIDSLIETYINNFNTLSLKNDSSTVMHEISSLIYQKQDLFQKKLSDQKMLGLQNAVEVVYGFAPTERKNLITGLPLSKIILLSLFLSLGVVIFLHFIWPKKVSE